MFLFFSTRYCNYDAELEIQFIFCSCCSLILLSFVFLQQYYDECHGVIYVIDSSDQNRLEESHKVFGKLIKIYYFVYLILREQFIQLLK